MNGKKELVNNILLHCYTDQQAHHCLHLWRKIMENILYKKNLAVEKNSDAFIALAKKTLSQEDKKFFLGWSVSFLNELTPENFPNFIEGVESMLYELDTIPVWLAFTPKYELEKKIYMFFAEKIKGNFLLSIHVDKSIIGGVVFEYKNSLYNYSIRQKVLDSKTDVKKIISAYA